MLASGGEFSLLTTQCHRRAPELRLWTMPNCLPEGRLAAALERAGFWELLGNTDARIVIAPELAGFAAGSPTATDPALVETLIELLHDRGYVNVAVAGSADSSSLWAANRDVYALTDLLGYRFAHRLRDHRPCRGTRRIGVPARQPAAWQRAVARVARRGYPHRVQQEPHR